MQYLALINEPEYFMNNKIICFSIILTCVEISCEIKIDEYKKKRIE